MTDRKKKASKIILYIILALVSIVFILFILVAYPAVKRMNILNGITDDRSVYTPPKTYQKSDLEGIVGTSLSESGTEFYGKSCVKYWNNQNVPTEYDDLRFYVFDSEKAAKKAFKAVKDHKEVGFREITDEGDDYIRGWQAGVVDADIEEYIYINGNLIVTAVVTSVDGSARAVDDPEPAVRGGGEEALATIRLIRDNF